MPDLGNGIVEVPGNVYAIALPEKFRRGYIQSWNLTIQKEVKRGFVAEAGYVATRQTRQLGFRPLNWSSIGRGTEGRQLFERFGRTADTDFSNP